MRCVPGCTLMMSFALLAPAAQLNRVTILFDFQGPHSPAAIRAMEKEFAAVMKHTGYAFDWRPIGNAASESYDNLVVVRFKGNCVLAPVGYLYDERGPLAFTYSTGREILPFSEVACDKVAATVRSSRAGLDYGRADALMGRALGRVVAHEMVHMLTRSGDHGKDGAAQPALSGRDLISGELPLASSDVRRLKPE